MQHDLLLALPSAFKVLLRMVLSLVSCSRVQIFEDWVELANRLRLQLLLGKLLD